MLPTRHSIFIIRMAVSGTILVNGQGPISAQFLVQKTSPRLREASRRYRGHIDLRPALATHFLFGHVEFCREARHGLPVFCFSVAAGEELRRDNSSERGKLLLLAGRVLGR